MSTIRLTAGQALVRYLSHQWTERDGRRQRLIAGAFGIFGHGNVAGFGQGLVQAHREALAAGFDGDEPGPDELPYFMARNEQSMVHAAVGYARAKNRLSTYACTASIGPGSTNMITGAALASIDRIPVLLLPSDVFANRIPDPVLQQLENPVAADVTVNDAFRPVSRYFDRIWRPEMLLASAPQAMRVLTDPAETGAVTLSLPQDVQAQAYDWPVEFFADRTWHIARPVPEPEALQRAVQAIRGAKAPLVIAGGGVIYSEASEALTAFADATGIPVADTQAGKGAIAWDHPSAVGGVGSTGNEAANDLARGADVVIGIGTRYIDFTTASHTIFANPEVQFVNINVAAFDAIKQGGQMVIADARRGLEALTQALAGWSTTPAYREQITAGVQRWQEVTRECYEVEHQPVPAQTAIFGALNEAMGPDSVLINAAGSMPGDLQALWRASGPGQYHLEYGFSCMGYEIPAAMGVKLARPEAEVVAIVGDGTYQMLPQELATIASEGIKVIIVLLDNGGYASIGALSESVGSQRFGTRFGSRGPARDHDGPPPAVDLAANAESFGVRVLRATTVPQFKEAFASAQAADNATVVHIATALQGPNPPSSAWWDVPVAQVSTLDSTSAARRDYEQAQLNQRRYY